MLCRTLLLAQLFSAPCLCTAEEWQTLFNGKDLTGWRANVMPESFTVVDGAIRANAKKPSAHLFYAGDMKTGFMTFKNFIFEATCRSEPNSNSGIFIHTDMTTRDSSLHLAKGYEIQLNSTAKEKRKTGSLYAVVDLAQSPVDESQWFRIRVIVRDKRIMIQLNDEPVVDYTEPPNVTRPPDRAGRLINSRGGGIALQAHDPGSVFYFKDIRIQRLP
jgi:3-keto-disaccharide hydrolase